MMNLNTTDPVSERENKVLEKEGSHTKPKLKQSALKEWITTGLICLVIALFITTFIIHPMTVPTGSMEPTILVGDRLFVDKLTLRADETPLGHILGIARPIKRGDIIVFKYPRKPGILFVKRVIGLPGETIALRGKTVYINGKALKETYAVYNSKLPADYLSYLPMRNFGPYKIPEEHYFMMGDNRDNSSDSRFWGTVPRSYIMGRPLIIFWSFEDPPDVQDIKKPLPLLKLYMNRIIHFFGKTRWTRMFHFVGGQYPEFVVSKRAKNWR